MAEMARGLLARAGISEKEAVTVFNVGMKLKSALAPVVRRAMESGAFDE